MQGFSARIKLTRSGMVEPHVEATEVAEHAVVDVPLCRGSLIEAKLLYGYFPYKRSIIAPIIVALVGVAFMAGIYDLTKFYLPSYSIWGAVLGLFLALVLEARYGLNHKDLVALGRPSQWLAGKRFKKVE